MGATNSRKALPLALLSALVGACSESATPVDAAADSVTQLDAALDVTDERRADVPPMRDRQPDDVDPSCAANATDRCLDFPPGPCANLADGRERAVSFQGFSRNHTVSCNSRTPFMGPDAVLPLTLAQASDVAVTAAPGTGDNVIVALYPADGCGEPAREITCVNASGSIGGIATFRANNLAPGNYALLLSTARGVDVRVSASVTPARLRPAGDICPGVTVTPDGPAVDIDTRPYDTRADYGTTCGRLGPMGGLGWMDAVFSYTIDQPRDVTIEVDGEGTEDLHVELSRTCGSISQVLPGCETGLPVQRIIRNQAPGTWYVVVDYKPEARPDHVLHARVTTAPPTPPGPASRCPGVAITEGMPVTVDVSLLTPGMPLGCIPRQTASGVFSFMSPEAGSDLMVGFVSPGARDDAALVVRSTCDGEIVGPCIGPEDRSGRSAWTRLQGLAPGRTWYLQGATSSAAGNATARVYRVPHVDPRAVTNNFTCATAEVIPATGGIFTGSNTSATAVANPPCASMSLGCAGSRGSLYRLDLAARQRVVAVMRSETFDTLLSVQSGMNCPGRNGSALCNDDWYSTDSQVDTTLDPGTYWIHAGGCGPTQAGDYRLDVAVLPP